MTAWAVVGFVAIIVTLVAVDLGVFNRRPRALTLRESLVWTGAWVGVGAAFSVVIWFLYENDLVGRVDRSGQRLGGFDAAGEYLAAFLLEKVLSLDIMFVIAAVYASLRVPAELQHRVLFWGLLVVVVMRGVVIALGGTLLWYFEWMSYIFGAALLFGALKMLLLRTDLVETRKNRLVQLLKRVVRVTPDYHGAKLLVRIDGRLTATPLLVALIAVEASDFVFSIDSIPAAYSITDDPFLVLTSNVFAVLGIRALYFVLAASIGRFHYLKYCLAIVLAFVGIKLLISNYLVLSPEVSAAAIAAVMALGVIASIVDARQGRSAAEAPLGPEMERIARDALSQARKIVVLVIGVTILLLAIPIGLLPGPGGILVALLGLAILATEFIWAKKMLDRVKRTAQNVQKRTLKMLRIGPKKGADASSAALAPGDAVAPNAAQPEVADDGHDAPSKPGQSE